MREIIRPKYFNYKDIIFLLLLFLLSSCSYIAKKTYDADKPQITLRLSKEAKTRICAAFEAALENKDLKGEKLCQAVSLAYSQRANPMCYDTYRTGDAICAAMDGFLCKDLNGIGQAFCMRLDGKFCSVSLNDAQGLCNALGSKYCSVLKQEDDKKWYQHFRDYCNQE